ncbi:MAG: valyl-tRNA synthetase [Kiritimatiellia bacterium]|jgi:valyl-tRNA synthetase
MSELDKHLDPAAIEAKWYAKWEADKAFSSDHTQGGESYSIVIPPPNVTGVLHMGHALNNTVQDVLIRWKRMQGFNTVWIPGTDHAGIATQNVVERDLKKQGLTRDDLGREKFLEKVWEYKEQNGSTITHQLRKLGCSCDWEREAFTMSPGLSRAVREVFCRLYEKELIYRGNRIINWCSRCHTALSDEESEHQKEQGKFYHIRYMVKGGTKKQAVIVATTRPETLLGDTGIAINPRDERYAHLKEKTPILPILGRELIVIEDDYVDPEFGTGVVKVTPAHDPNDYDMGMRHDLPSINVMNDDGTMNENAGPYAGQDRFECRKNIVADLEAAGLLVKVEDHEHQVGHCYRCDTVVEPRLSPQWFVKMKPLARPAINVVKDGQVKFVPERWNKTYLNWMENIRDWCISRQIWWGHRIPVFYCNACEHEWADREDAHTCPSCSSNKIRQDEDVLDTWFSSWLWPFSTLGWPEESADMKCYYPTNALSTAPEIIFFWVARMIMAGLEFMGDVPFTEVYLHGTVRDELGRKMSKSPLPGKSYNNSIDPLDVIEKYSADSLRFTLIMLTATGQDVQLTVGFDKDGELNDKLRDEFKDFEIGRNFATKIWNAARFMQMQGETPADFASPKLKKSLLSSDDKHILFKLQNTINTCTENLEKYRFNDYAKELYDFLWHNFCDWYLESSKEAFFGEDAARKHAVLQVMHHVFHQAMRLLHPLMPFVTEELWHAMGYNGEYESIMTAPWPVALEVDELKPWGATQVAFAYVEDKRDLIRAGRLLKSDYNLAAKRVNFTIKPNSEKASNRLEKDLASVVSLLKADLITIDPSYEPASAIPSALTKLGSLYMPVENLIDKDAEVERLMKELNKVQGNLEKVTQKLENEKFVSNAPKEVIARQKELKKELLEQSEKLNKLVSTLSD